MASFSLSWDAYKQNICQGVAALQQNGEFVDMTLAADGHHVKVHQMILSLASPYIKELIMSTKTKCPHPIIFLNKISFPILSAILEYVYTGEVVLHKDNLEHLIEAAKELHIKGLEDMKLELSTPEIISQATLVKNNQGQPLSGTVYKNESEKSSATGNKIEIEYNEEYPPTENDTFDDAMNTDVDDYQAEQQQQTKKTKITSTTKKPEKPDTRIQYTVTNQGALQMILNRCIYYLRYTSRKGPSGHRQWRCIYYVKSGIKCPATVITQDDVVTKRFSAHNHPFHDKQILKKVRNNAIYSAIHEAEEQGKNKKLERHNLPTISNKESETD